jgi:GDP-4-dehydro-6-deoxy-D-mannose reductase
MAGAETRVLVTGAQGFVGPHVAAALRRVCGVEIAILGTAKEAGEHAEFGVIEALDVTDAAAVSAAIASHEPTHVIHLAGIAAPVAAGANPDAAWRVHVQGARNLGQAILRNAPNCWLLHVGSGMVYGETAKAGLPLGEDSPLAPIDEYSLTKAVADLSLGTLKRQGLQCVRFRPFNHTGHGQTEAFVVPAFAKQIAMIEAGYAPPVIRVGNLEAERDFLDVRDVARAYALAVPAASTIESGTILNISSGIPRRVQNILDWFLAKSSVKITVEQDHERLRPSDLPRIIGDSRRARKCLRWDPEYGFEDTLSAVLEDWRERVRIGPIL